MLKRLVKRGARSPAQIFFYFGIVYTVTSVVARPVGDEFYQFGIIASARLKTGKQIANAFCQSKVVNFVARTDIVSFAKARFMENQIQSLAVVPHVKPIPDIAAVAVDGYIFPD